MSMEEIGARLVLAGQDAFVSGMQKAENQSTGFGRALSKVADGIAQGFGQALFGAVSKGIGMIPNMLEDAYNSTVEWGKSLDDIGDILGTTTKESAGLASMFKTIGGSSDQLTSAIALMTKGLENAKGEVGPTGAAIKSLGINFKDAKGKILPATKIFQLVSDKIGNMPEGLEKTSIMMDIFGKSGKEMGDALNEAANGGMDLYIRQAEAMGLAMDPEQIIRNNKAIETLKLTFTGLANRMLTAVLPVVEQVTYGFVHMLQDPNIQKNIADLSKSLVDIWTWTQANIVPLLIRMYDWLYTNIPVAIAFLKKTWETVFLPPIQTAWNWIKDNVGPIVTSVQKWMDTDLPKAIASLKSAWETQFSPAIQTAWNWVKDNTSPVWQPVQNWIETAIPTAIGIGKAAWDTYNTTLSEVVTYVNGPVKTAFDSMTLQLNTEMPGAIDSFKTKFYYQLYPAMIEVRNYINDYVVPIFDDLGGIITTITDMTITPLKDLLVGSFYTAWTGLASVLKIDVAGAFDGLQSIQLNGIVNFFNGPFASALNNVHTLLTQFQGWLDSIHIPSWNIPSFGGGDTWHGNTTTSPYGEEQFASGGSFVIPQGFGYEGFNLGGIATASGGEVVTITPKNVSAGPASATYNYSTNYNLNLATTQSMQTVQQSFAMMKLLAG